MIIVNHLAQICPTTQFRRLTKDYAFPQEVQSRITSRVRSKGTKPEITARRILWRLGLRYRLHDRTLPGTPDISNRKRRLAVR